MNIIKVYDSLLELSHLNEPQAIEDLRRIFDRDFSQKLHHQNWEIEPLPNNTGGLDQVFHHLTTKEALSRKGRDLDRKRSQRLHWISPHLLEEITKTFAGHKVDSFILTEGRGVRRYLLNHYHKYVVVLEPLRNKSAYYLLSAYPLDDNRRYKEMLNKFQRSQKQIAPPT